MAGFVEPRPRSAVEFKTSRIDEIEALFGGGEAQRPAASTVRRATVTADRDRPGYYLSILEFDSYESAMENSNLPETNELSAAMAKLCDGPPKFYNLDVYRVME